MMSSHGLKAEISNFTKCEEKESKLNVQSFPKDSLIWIYIYKAERVKSWTME